MPRRKGLFIVLEGPDKSGKSTQARLLVEELKRLRKSVVHTREPGGSGVAESIRKVLLDPSLNVSPVAELFLYEASRSQHTAEVLLPALVSGKIVVCERYTLSTDVYQGLARGLGLRTTRSLNAVATGGLKPDLTVVIDIPDAEFVGRDRSRRLDRLERETSQFRRKVRQGYRKLARRAPRTLRLDGTRPAEELLSAILKRVRRLLP